MDLIINIKEEKPVKNNIQINRDALFSAETEDYRMPAEPDIHDKVVVRMRTAKDDVDHVYYKHLLTYWMKRYCICVFILWDFPFCLCTISFQRCSIPSVNRRFRWAF